MDKRKGFTLIELLVVIAIIAMLMAMLMPALGKVKKQAMNVACQATLRQWGPVFMMYCNDNDGLFSGGTDIAGVFWEHSWVYSLKPYFENMDVALCPAAKRTWMDEDSGTFVGWDWRAAKKHLPDPIYDYYEGSYGSYGENSWCGAWPYHGNCPDTTSPHICNWLTIRVKGGNRIPMFLDSLFMGGFPSDVAMPAELEGLTFWDGSQGGGGEMDRYCIPRHGRSVNSLFVDLSVREVGLKELWKLKWHREFDTNGMWTLAGGVTSKIWDDAAPWMRSFPEY